MAYPHHGAGGIEERSKKAGPERSVRSLLHFLLLGNPVIVRDLPLQRFSCHFVLLLNPVHNLLVNRC